MSKNSSLDWFPVLSRPNMNMLAVANGAPADQSGRSDPKVTGLIAGCRGRRATRPLNASGRVRSFICSGPACDVVCEI